MDCLSSGKKIAMHCLSLVIAIRAQGNAVFKSVRLQLACLLFRGQGEGYCRLGLLGLINPLLGHGSSSHAVRLLHCKQPSPELSAGAQGRHEAALQRYNKAMHWLDPESFEAGGPPPSAEDIQRLGRAFIAPLLNRCLLGSLQNPMP